MKEESILEIPALQTKAGQKGKTDNDSRLKQVINESTYWKKSSVIWPIAQILAFTAALFFNLYFPSKQLVDVKPYRIFLLFAIAFFIGRYAYSFFNTRVKAANNHQSQFYFAVGLILILWDYLTTKSNILPLPFFPSLAQILQVMVEDTSTLAISTLYSLRLLVIGFIIGTIIGLVTGVLIGWYREWNYWVFPVIKVMGGYSCHSLDPHSNVYFPIKLLCTNIFAGTLCLVPCSLYGKRGYSKYTEVIFRSSQNSGRR